MTTGAVETAISIPCRVVDLESFRRWARSDDFPERGRFSFLASEIWVDMSPEDLYTHNQVKSEFGFVIRGLLKRYRRGRYFVDGAFLSNAAADLSTEPDGMCVSWESFKSGRVKQVQRSWRYRRGSGTKLAGKSAAKVTGIYEMEH